MNRQNPCVSSEKRQGFLDFKVYLLCHSQQEKRFRLPLTTPFPSLTDDRPEPLA